MSASAKMPRRPSRVEIARALLDLKTLWKPPDPENGGTPAGNRGAERTELHDRLKSTRATLDEQGDRP